MADLAAGVGIPLDEWQTTVLKAAMGEREDGTWAAKQVGLSAPRQNGKSLLIVARALAGALVLGERKIIISAHQQDTARETFAEFLRLFNSSDALSRRIDPAAGGKVMNALNREFIRFTNGAEIQFKARSKAGGRGFSADLLLLDEAQILGMSAWVSINSTMSARPNPQIWLMGTPPTPEDDGEVFSSIRETARGGSARTLAYLEWSASPDDDPALEETRAAANPAWFERINHDVVQGEFESYPKLRFAMDRLGIWLTEMPRTLAAITPDQWNRTGVAEPPVGSVRSYGVAFSADGMRVSLAGALRHDDGVHVELIDAFGGSIEAGLAPLADWLAERRSRGASFVLSGRAGAGVLAQLLSERRVRGRQVSVATTPQYFQACGMFLDSVNDGSVTHLVSSGQARLDDSVAVCDKKFRGQDGAWGWESTVADGDDTPLEAVSLALWGARTSARNSTGPRVVVM